MSADARIFSICSCDSFFFPVVDIVDTARAMNTRDVENIIAYGSISVYAYTIAVASVFAQANGRSMSVCWIGLIIGRRVKNREYGA